MPPSIHTALCLTTREIRLLTLQASDTEDEISCKLRKVRIDDSTHYQALSYVWGTEEAIQSITVNGHKINVRPNLYSALRQFRKSDTSIDIWCDALCVNQEDFDERNHQVLRMREIYERAERVIIWLGDYEEKSDLALKNIRDWGLVYPELEETPSALLQSMLGHMFDTAAWEATNRLFARPWWFRVWVLQEVAVSRSAVLVCGSDQCEWDLFIRARAAWDALQEPDLQRHLTKDQVETLMSITSDSGAAALTLQASQRMGTPMGLLPMMRYTCGFNATDPRDKLYALLGMSSIVDVTVEPSYTDPFKKVYTDFVRAFARDKRRASFLAGAGVGNPRLEPYIDLPSWVPDLRGRLRITDDYTLFDAAGQTDASITFSADSRFISTQAVICSCIERIEPQPQGDLLGRTRWVDLMLSQKQPLYPTGIPRIQAYLRTLTGDTSNSATRPKNLPDPTSSQHFYNVAAGFLFILGCLLPYRSTFKQHLPRLSTEQKELLAGLPDYVQVYAEWEGCIPHPVSEERVLSSFLGDVDSKHRLHWPGTSNPKLGEECVFLFVRAMAEACRDRSFFVTDDGYMGLAPAGALSGDVVCVVLGCEVPVLVRKNGDRHVLVGPCYVLGFMHGECMQDVREGRRRLEGLEIE